MTRTVVTLPSFDMPSRWASAFFNRYITPFSFMRFLGTSPLYRQADNRRLFSRASTISNFVTGVGHGDGLTFTGQYKQVLWKVGQYNPSECKGKIIKLLSCECGEKLGPDLIEKGASAFQGYTSVFAYFVDAKHVLFPWLDPVCSGFISPVIKGVKAFLEGKTNEEAYEIEYNLHTESIEKEADPELKAWKKHNRDCFIMLGDPDVRFNRDKIK